MYTLNFAQTTKITNLTKKLNEMYRTDPNLVEVFACLDVRDLHLIRVLKNLDIDYEVCEGKYLMEYNTIPLENKGKLSPSELNTMLVEDTMDNYDVLEFDSLKEVMNHIKSGGAIEIPTAEK